MENITITLILKVESNHLEEVQRSLESSIHDDTKRSEDLIISSLEDEAIKSIANLPIIIPAGIAGVKILVSFIENYFKGKQSKEIEITNTENGRAIKIKGFSKKESEEIIKKFLNP